MILKLRPPTDPLLLTPAQTFDFSVPPFDPIAFAHDLVETMYHYNGAGIAFNQLYDDTGTYDMSVPYAVFAMRGHPENFVLYNPRIVASSDEKIELEEGCLSFPGLRVPVKRAEGIRVRFATPNGVVRTDKFLGMTARIVQHEMTHLGGVRFWDGVSRLKFNMALRKGKVKYAYR